MQTHPPRQAHLHIGTAGWHYQHWRGPFYPEKMPASQFLPYYAERFHTVEINNSFYRLPSVETMRAWRDAVPEGFVFAFKASRFITHLKKLKDPQEPLRNLYERVEALDAKRGPVLFQLPPRWRFNGERLQAFLACLSRTHRHAFEFRDPSWFNEAAYDALAQHGAAFCIYELAGLTAPREITADFVYVRLHGPGDAYQGSYSEEALTGWADACTEWTRQGRDVYCYFDNDQAGHAAHNALALRARSGQAAPPG